MNPRPAREFIHRAYTYEGDLVVDPFAGSGTTGVAAALTGRRFCGVEADAGYVKAARQRIDAARWGVEPAGS